MKILLVTSRNPFPPRRGDQLRATQALEFLRRAHEVTLLAPKNPTALPPPLRHEAYAPPRRIEQATAALQATFTGRPLQNALFHSIDLGRRLRALAPAHDVVVLQLERLASNVQDLGSAPLVVDLIDSLALNLERRAALDHPALRPLLRAEAKRLLETERSLLERADSVLVVSERDRRFLAERCGETLARKVTVLPLAVPLGESLPPTQPLSPQVASTTAVLAITGNLGYFPTDEGARWFLSEVWPRLIAQGRDVRLVIAGARPSRALERLARAPGVELQIAPSDLRFVLAGTDIALAPMRAGSGLPIKILEAWAHGVAVVATPWAAEGTTGVAGIDFAVAQPNPEAWIQTIERLLDDRSARERLATAGRTRLAADYSPDSVGARWLAAFAR